MVSGRASSEPGFSLAFLLYEYFPFGGLQRDCLATAEACVVRGHRVKIYTRTWAGERPATIGVEVLGQRGWTNVARNRIWQRRVARRLAEHGVDGVVGFNRMPGLDVYFGADPCYVAKMARLRPSWYRCFPRYRFYRAMEEAVFGRGRATQILLLTDHEVPLYGEHYGTEPERFHILPPGIERRAVTGECRELARRRLRGELGIGADDLLLLLVGSGFRVKGLDRALIALAALPVPLRDRARLVVIGKSPSGPFARQAERLGVGSRVHFLGPRSDVPEWLLAADVLVHPAYSESAGKILVEAVASGLPVLTTDTCGYAYHVERAGAGQVLSSPFNQESCTRALVLMMQEKGLRENWSRSGLRYGQTEDLYSCHERAAEVIERSVQGKVRARG